VKKKSEQWEFVVTTVSEDKKSSARLWKSGLNLEETGLLSTVC
jgi:hypothetical protein